MRLFALGLFILGTLGLSADSRAGDDKKSGEKNGGVEVKKPSEDFKTIQLEFEKAYDQYIQAMRSAQTPEAQKAAMAKRPNVSEYLKRLDKLMENNPKDITPDEIIFGIRLSGGNAKYISKLESFANSSKISSIMPMLAQGAPPQFKRFLEKVLAENPDKSNQGIACFALSGLAGEDSEKAEKYLTRIEKEYADVKIRTTTLGQLAKPALFEIKHLGIGKTAPDVVGDNLDGKEEKLSDYRGKVVVLDIWATWCGPCRAMIPHERDMVEKLKSKPFALISVSGDNTKDALTSFLEKEKMPWKHWWNKRDKGILKDWNIKFFPTIYVIDAKGVIRYKNIRGEELEKAVEKLLTETSK